MKRKWKNREFVEKETGWKIDSENDSEVERQWGEWDKVCMRACTLRISVYHERTYTHTKLEREREWARDEKEKGEETLLLLTMKDDENKKSRNQFFFS